MRRTILGIVLAALAVPALAANYPVSGRWGAGAAPAKGPVDCTKLRVIAFNGNQRTDSSGGVRAYQNRSVTPEGGGFRVVDVFTTGQISNAHVTYMLRPINATHLDMTQNGATLKLQRCK